MLLATSPTIGEWFAGVSATMASLAVFGGVGRWVVRSLIREENEKQAIKIHEATEKQLAPILAEVSNDHGTSLKDKVEHTGIQLAKLQVRVEDFSNNTNTRLTTIEDYITSPSRR